MPKTKTAQRKRKKRNDAHRPTRLPKGPNGGIELLLIQTVDALGRQGDVVEVRPGYAANYLIPQGLATIATDHHKRMVEKHRTRLLEIEKKRMAGLQTKADELSRQSVTIEANANDEGHLYGSVGAAEITSALKAAEHHHHQRPGAAAGPVEGAWPVHGQDSHGARDRSRSEGLGRAGCDRRRNQGRNAGQVMARLRLPWLMNAAPPTAACASPAWRWG